MHQRFVIGVVASALVAALGLAGPSARAQDGAAPDAKAVERRPTGAAAAELSWIAGHWRGEMFGSPVEEMWGAPRGGSMFGCCRLGDDGAKAMYEALLIQEVDGVPTMFLLHFKSGLVARETAPLAYPLVKSGPKEAVFEVADPGSRHKRIVYRLDGDDTLVVRLEGERDGKPTASEGRMRRVK
ncbi:MAG: DUF6265 family protein [Phycisphaerae bacterium]